jgi:hypothetical protein
MLFDSQLQSLTLIKATKTPTQHGVPKLPVMAEKEKKTTIKCALEQ